MAGDWVKMKTDLYRHPKVLVITDLLMDPGSDLSQYVNQNAQRDMTVTRNIMRNVTVGALVSVWGVLRHRGTRNDDDLVVSGCSVSIMDDIADIPGFGDAMVTAEWAVSVDDGFILPRFFVEMNVDPDEERRAKDAERQRRFRAKNKSNSNVTDNVTVTSQCHIEKSREEKSREDKRLKEYTPARAESAPVTMGSNPIRSCVNDIPIIAAILDNPKFQQFIPAYPAGHRCAPRVAAAAFAALKTEVDWDAVISGLDFWMNTKAWKEHDYQYAKNMREFIETEMWKGAGTCKRQRKGW